MQLKSNKPERNIAIDYLYSALHNFDVARSIWVLYLVMKGMSLWEVGLLEGIFHIISFLFEVPTGAAADLFGRKKTLLAGRMFLILSSLLMLYGNHFWQFAVSFSFSALSYNLNSGAEEALVYDSLKELDQVNRYLKINSRINIIVEISLGLSTFLGGLLADYSFEMCYIISVIFALLSLLPALLFYEPKQSTGKRRKQISVRKHFVDSYRVIKGNPNIIPILLYYPAVFTFATVSFYYGQEYFSTLGFRKVYISLFLLLQSGGSLLGAISCEKLVALLGRKAKYIASVLMGVSILLFGLPIPVLSIMVFVVIGYVNSVLYPIQSSLLNALLPSDQRATILSVDSMIFSAMMVIIFPACGFLADHFGFLITFSILGGLQLCFMLVLFRIKRITG